jgi:DNA-binding protein HU-beta
MNKTQLIDAIATSTGKSKADVTAFMNATVDAIQGAVAAGDEVQIVGFGTWKRGVLKGRTLPSITTGERITYGDTWVVRFTGGSAFKSAVKAGSKTAA